MKYLLIIWIFAMLFSCSSQKQNDKETIEEKHSLSEIEDDSPSSTEDVDDDWFSSKNTNDYITDSNNYIISTYDLSGVEDDKESLRQLSNNNLFSSIQKIVIQNLTEKHKNYFILKPDFELLFYSKGDLFQNNKNDYAFVVYDKENSRITILLYDESANQYSELYRDIKVEGELECNYYHHGTLDYKLGKELLYHKKHIEKDITKAQENYLTYYNLCKITNILSDEDIILERGCFAKDISKENPLNSLSIATSFIYNNWESLLYDKSKNTFKIIYGQEFSD